MEYYCLMVRTGEEEEFKKKARKAFCEQACTAELYYFQRTLKTNQGKLYEKPLFPGYLFFQTESLTPQIMQTLKKIDGFIRILLVYLCSLQRRAIRTWQAHVAHRALKLKIYATVTTESMFAVK